MNRLKELRTITKKTQQNIAEFLQMSRRGYQKIENGESQIKPDKAQALADYFGVSDSVLLGFRDTSDSSGFRLWILRNEKGIELKKAAQDLNLSEEELGHLERTDNLKLGTALAKDFANYYDVPVEYLLRDEEEPLLEEIAQELSGYITKKEWEIIHSDPTQEQYYMSIAWNRMLEAGRVSSSNTSEPILSTNIYKDIENVTDIETLDGLISDTLLANRLLDNLKDKVLSSDIINSQEYNNEIEKVMSWLIDFNNALAMQKLQLITKKSN